MDLIFGKMQYKDGVGVLFIDKLPDIILNLSESVDQPLLDVIVENIRSESELTLPGSRSIVNSLVQILLAHALSLSW